MALWLAFLVRLGPENMIDLRQYGWLFLVAICTALPVFALSGLYRAVLRYMDRDTITRLFIAATISALLLALAIYWARSNLLLPRSLIVNYWFILFGLVGGSRFTARAFLLPGRRSTRLRSLITPDTGNRQRRVAIYGAGSAGVQLLNSIQHDREILPLAFIDDNPNLKGRVIGGVRIFLRDELPRLMKKHDIQEVFLAIPSLQPVARQDILQFLEQFPVHVRTVPSIFDLATGRKGVMELQEVRVEDILGRDVVHPIPELLERCVKNKSVMVTGGGGSIGSELCRQIIALHPKSLVIYEHSEFNLFSIEDELREEISRRKIHIELVPILGSVLDRHSFTSAIRTYDVQTIYHTAAYKHVSIVEQNIAAGIRNNVFGTLYSVCSAIETRVENFVLISTDKAVRPHNAMGASKRLSEMILQALAAEPSPELGPFAERSSEAQSPTTRFTIVRFGNVLGSSGSVIPKFRKQIQEGGPVTVTHRGVTRYFMTMSEAAQLVIQASSMGTGGDVYILDMGAPVPIMELATKMIRLSGRTPRTPEHPDGDIDIQIIGLRPGEKLHEELLTDNRPVIPTGHPKISQAREAVTTWSSLLRVLLELESTLEGNDIDGLQNILIDNVDGYQPRGRTSTQGPAHTSTKVVRLKPS